MTDQWADQPASRTWSEEEEKALPEKITLVECRSLPAGKVLKHCHQLVTHWSPHKRVDETLLGVKKLV